MLKKLNHGLAVLYAWGELLALLGALIFFICLLGTFLQPLSPIFTALLVLSFSTRALLSGKFNATMAITGALLFPLAWPVTHHFGVTLGLAIWTVAVGLWMIAVYRSFLRPLDRLSHSRTVQMV